MKFDQTLRYCIKKANDESANVTYYINIQQNQAPLNSLLVYITSINKYDYNTKATIDGYQYLPQSKLVKTLSMIQASEITCMDTRIRTIRSIIDKSNDKLQIIVGCKNGLISIFEENITELILSSLSNNCSNIIKSSKSYVVTHLKGEVALIKYFDRYIFAFCITSNESILLIETPMTSNSNSNNADNESHDDCHSFMRLMIDYECSSVLPLLYVEEGNYSGMIL